MGRANVENRPVFYGSSEVVASILEVIFTRSDCKINTRPRSIFVSKWRVKSGNRVNSYRTSLRLPFNPQTGPLNQIIAYNNYLSAIEKCFLVENGYGFSSKFSDLLLYNSIDNAPRKNKSPFSIIEYPSVVDEKLIAQNEVELAKKYHAKNYAIEPNFFDANYEFVEVMHLGIPDDLEENIRNYITTMHVVAIEKGVIDEAYSDVRLRWIPPDKELTFFMNE